MVYVIEAQLSGDNLPLQHTRATLPDTSLRFEYQTGRNNEISFITIDSTVPTNVIAETFSEDPDILGFTLISHDSHRALYQLHLNRELHVGDLITSLAELGIHVLHAIGNPDGWRGTLQTEDMANFQEFQKLCRGRNVNFSIESLQETDQYMGGVRMPLTQGMELTDLQRNTLFVADDLGYFETPREATLQDVAEELGISSSATGRRLSRAVKSLVSDVRRHTPSQSTGETDGHERPEVNGP